MFLNTRSLITATFFSLLSIEAGAVVLKPIKNPDDLLPGHSKRDISNDVILKPLSDPGVLTGNFVKRAATGNEAFDPSSRAELFWGAYAGNNIVTANFTMSSPDDDEMILPIENFAQHLKSLTCGTEIGIKGIVMEFSDKTQFDYAQSKWQWINEKDPNHFILVTQESQCYPGDDRSPYLVQNIAFDAAKLTATVDADEKEWGDIVDDFELHVGHTYVDPATANATHPQLMHKRDDKKMNLDLDWNQPIFDYSKDSKETAGMRVSANAHIQTGGAIIADFSITKKKVVIVNVPNGVDITMKPQGVWGQLLLSLELDGKLGKEFDWSMAPTIGIPVGGFKIAGLVEIGPIAEMGIHFGSTALEGTATFSTGAKATLKDSALASFSMTDSSKNSINNDWAPTFQKVDPRFTAEIKGGVKAWAELSFKVKAVALGKFGYEAGIEAELPYIEADIAAKLDTKAGVCDSKKAMGLEISCGVGINVHLEAGQPDKDPDFEKDLYDTKWPLYSTCMGFGSDITTTSVGAPPHAGPAGPKTTSGKATATSAKPTSKVTTATGTAKPTSASATGKPSSSAHATTSHPVTEKPVSSPVAPSTKLASSGIASSSKAASSGVTSSVKASTSVVASQSKAADVLASTVHTSSISKAVSGTASSVTATGTSKPASASTSSVTTSHVYANSTKVAIPTYGQVSHSSVVSSVTTSNGVPSGSVSATVSSKIPLSTGATTDRGSIPVVPSLPSVSVSSILAGPTAPIVSSVHASGVVSSYVAQTTLPTSVAQIISSAAGHGQY